MTSSVERKVFIFQTIIYKVFRLNTLGQQRSHFVYHPLLESFPKPCTDATATHLSVYVDANGVGGESGKRPVLKWMLYIVFCNLNGTYGPLCGVDIGRVVQTFVGLQDFSEFRQGFPFQ